VKGASDDAEGQGRGDLWGGRRDRGAIARAFARERASVFPTGHYLASVKVLAKEIEADGGSAEAAEVDALDEQAVNEHLQSVIDRRAASISRSTRSASRTRRSWVCP
jgi:hypothetical protein